MLWVCWNTLNCSFLALFCILFRRHSCINIPPACTPPVKCRALHGILSSGGNLFSASCYSDLSQENVPLWNPTSLLIGARCAFFECGQCQEKTDLPHGPYWEIIREREEREGKHDLALFYWSSSVEWALLLATVYLWQRKPACRNLYLCLRNVNMFRWTPQEGSWSLWSAVCSALPHTCSFHRFPVWVAPAGSLRAWSTATFQLAVCHPAACGMLPGLKCFADRF